MQRQMLMEREAGEGTCVTVACAGPGALATAECVVDDDPEERQALTDREPPGRTGRPEVVANSLRWLPSSDASSVADHVRNLDGGRRARS